MNNGRAESPEPPATETTETDSNDRQPDVTPDPPVSAKAESEEKVTADTASAEAAVTANGENGKSADDDASTQQPAVDAQSPAVSAEPETTNGVDEPNTQEEVPAVTKSSEQPTPEAEAVPEADPAGAENGLADGDVENV